ncbi:helix-turn-helix domain-containing protein [Paenibacillus sp. 22594]|uniref:helix-turn-helix domain-containing protein n=1 Tax=Paenibacillus sp. 22594 TaxID=3453947 RepID=UPI003F82D30B
MEEQDAQRNEAEDREIEQLIERIVVDHDEQAMLAFLTFFEEDMNVLSKYMRMSKEDAMQSLKLGMLEMILNN